jgi:predicted kinase
MKSLSLSRPLVIMVVGLPGAGKSFFARQFADMFNAPLISTDKIRYTLFENSAYSSQEDALVQEITNNQIEELLKTGKTIVVDGGVNSRTARLNINKLAHKHGYGKMVVWIQTDEPTSLARSIKRSEKRKGDEMNAPMSAAAFERYKRLFSIPTVSENVIVISGKHTYATQARVILKKLVSPRDIAVSSREPESKQIQVTSEPTNDVQPRRRNVTIN